jgi:hypothetical protein
VVDQCCAALAAKPRELRNLRVATKALHTTPTGLADHGHNSQPPLIAFVVRPAVFGGLDHRTPSKHYCRHFKHVTSGVDLTLAIGLAASSRSECQIQNSTIILYLTVVLILTFAATAVGKGCECWNWTTGQVQSTAAATCPVPLARSAIPDAPLHGRRAAAAKITLVFPPVVAVQYKYLGQAEIPVAWSSAGPPLWQLSNTSVTPEARGRNACTG